MGIQRCLWSWIKDTTLAGTIQDSTGTEISKFSKVELKGDGVIVYFTAQGYDVYMTMNKRMRTM
jgi:uncharacterized protein YvpB